MGFWKNKNVFVTGHTGFKGSWLSLWLQKIGSNVSGYSLAPSTIPNLFELAGVDKNMNSVINDIRKIEDLRSSIKSIKPEIIFHLAAQPLVRESYLNPIETFETNLMGTVNLLESIREVRSVKAVVVVTTDKCYENDETGVPFVEADPIGGFDPYSSSKGCAELSVSAYYRSFLKEAGVGVGTARAGNVIGGGDWGKDRIIPDLLKAIKTNKPLKIRNPDSIRPWQHVLDPLFGYILLAEKLYSSPDVYSGGWNFGPNQKDSKPVSWVVEKMIHMLNQGEWEKEQSPQPHEAGVLRLNCSKASEKLNWTPRLSVEESLMFTSEWVKAWLNNKDLKLFCIDQIEKYSNKTN